MKIENEMLTLTVEGQEWKIPYCDGGYAKGRFPICMDQCITTGAWIHEDQFWLRSVLCGNWSVTMQLMVMIRDHLVSVRMSSSLRECLDGWNGEAIGTVVEI